MHADTTARYHQSRISPHGGAPTDRASDNRVLSELFRPPPHRIDPAEIVAPLTEGADRLPALMVERLEGLREYVGDFVVKNMNTPRPQLGFNTEAVEPITVKELEQELWGSHNKLEELYRSFEPTEQSSLAYRALIVDIKAQLKTVLLNMKTNQLDDGLGAVEKPAFLGACIHLENYVGQTIQKVEGVRVAVKEDVASLQGAGAASAEG